MEVRHPLSGRGMPHTTHPGFFLTASPISLADSASPSARTIGCRVLSLIQHDKYRCISQRTSSSKKKNPPRTFSQNPTGTMTENIHILVKTDRLRGGGGDDFWQYWTISHPPKTSKCGFFGLIFFLILTPFNPQIGCFFCPLHLRVVLKVLNVTQGACPPKDHLNLQTFFAQRPKRNQRNPEAAFISYRTFSHPPEPSPPPPAKLPRPDRTLPLLRFSCTACSTWKRARSACCCATCLASTAEEYSRPKVRCTMATSCRRGRKKGT